MMPHGNEAIYRQQYAKGTQALKFLLIYRINIAEYFKFEKYTLNIV